MPSVLPAADRRYCLCVRPLPGHSAATAESAGPCQDGTLRPSEKEGQPANGLPTPPSRPIPDPPRASRRDRSLTLQHTPHKYHRKKQLRSIDGVAPAAAVTQAWPGDGASSGMLPPRRARRATPRSLAQLLRRGAIVPPRQPARPWAAALYDWAPRSGDGCAACRSAGRRPTPQRLGARRMGAIEAMTRSRRSAAAPPRLNLRCRHRLEQRLPWLDQGRDPSQHRERCSGRSGSSAIESNSRFA